MKIRILLLFFFCAVIGETVAQSSRFSQDLAQHNVRIWNASNINTEAPEFSPVRYLNGIVYVSRRRSGQVDWKTGQTFYELFYSELDVNGIPSNAQNFSAEINSRLHEGPVAFNRQGNRIFFTRSNSKDGASKADSKGRVRLKIYEAVKGEFDWEGITELSFNRDEFSCMHPSLSADGTTLYFSSNMPGGFGGMDLYITKRRADGSWMKPINLGPDINTNKNEVFPFIHDSGMLFFTSDGHPGFGGLDLFMINLGSKRWSEVVNLGQPFNSNADDLSLIINSNGTRGYFTSSRAGGAGKDDIYVFETPDGLRGLEVVEKNIPLATVFDISNQTRLAGVALRVFERSEEGYLGNEALYDIKLQSNEGVREEMTLHMVLKRENELGPPQYITNREGQSYLQFRAGQGYLVLASKTGYETQEFILSAEQNQGNAPIEIRMEPRNCIPLDGYVQNIQTGKGIPNVNLRLVNHCTRAEINLKSNVEGKFEGCIDIGCEFSIIAEKTGYQSKETSVSTEKVRGSRSMTAEISLLPVSQSVFKEPIQEGTVIVLQNIFYDFNKSAIRKGDAQELEALVKLMKTYPSMEIELAAHTDSRGEANYNLELSLKRAESAKAFLVRKGIAPERINAVGFGESRIRNRCFDGVQCPDAEHQFNRRTEVKILHIDESVQLQGRKD